MGFLAGSLQLASEYYRSQDAQALANVDIFNRIWRELPGKERDPTLNYRTLRIELKKLSDLELAYLAFRCDEFIEINLYTNYVTLASLYSLLIE